VEEMISLARELGVRMIACEMSRDLMGIKESELPRSEDPDIVKSPFHQGGAPCAELWRLQPGRCPHAIGDPQGTWPGPGSSGVRRVAGLRSVRSVRPERVLPPWTLEAGRVLCARRPSAGRTEVFCETRPRRPSRLSYC
ncbi:MAG: hypothetical protein DMG27_07280, partial [Acidobacteria bacterium]